MKKEQLQAIKERASKATPGPWKVEESRYEGKFNAASVDGNFDLSACLMRIDDAEFVANARHDVPVLVAEVERLQRALESVETACHNGSSYFEIAKTARQALGGEQND